MNKLYSLISIAILLISFALFYIGMNQIGDCPTGTDKMILALYFLVVSTGLMLSIKKDETNE